MKNLQRKINFTLSLLLCFVAGCRTTQPNELGSKRMSDPVSVRSWSPYLSCDQGTLVLEELKVSQGVEPAATQQELRYRAIITNHEVIDQFNNVMAVGSDIEAPIQRWVINGLEKFSDDQWITTGQAPSTSNNIERKREPFAYRLELQDNAIVLAVFALADSTSDTIILDPTLLLAAASIGPCSSRRGISFYFSGEQSWPFRENRP